MPLKKSTYDLLSKYGGEERSSTTSKDEPRAKDSSLKQSTVDLLNKYRTSASDNYASFDNDVAVHTGESNVAQAVQKTVEEVDKQKEQSAVKDFMDITSGETVKGVTAALGGAYGAMGRTTGSVISGAGKWFWGGLGKYYQKFGEVTGSQTQKDVGLVFEQLGNKWEQDFGGVGEDVSRMTTKTEHWLNQNAERASDIIQEDVVIGGKTREEWNNKEFAAVEEAFKTRFDELEGESNRLKAEENALTALQDKTFYSQEEVDEYNARIEKLNEDIEKFNNVSTQYAQEYEEAWKNVKPEAFKFKDLTDPRFLMFDMYSSFLENAPTMAMQVYVGSKIVKANQGLGLLGKVLGIGEATTFSTAVNASREAEGQYSMCMSEGGSEDECFERAQRVYKRNFVGNTAFEGAQMFSILFPKIKTGNPFIDTLIQGSRVIGAGLLEATQERGEDYIQETAEIEKMTMEHVDGFVKKIIDPNISKTDVISTAMGMAFGGGSAVIQNSAEKHARKVYEGQMIATLEKMGIYEGETGEALDKKMEEVAKNNPTELSRNYQNVISEQKSTIEKQKANAIQITAEAVQTATSMNEDQIQETIDRIKAQVQGESQVGEQLDELKEGQQEIKDELTKEEEKQGETYKEEKGEKEDLTKEDTQVDEEGVKAEEETKEEQESYVGKSVAELESLLKAARERLQAVSKGKDQQATLQARIAYRRVQAAYTQAQKAEREAKVKEAVEKTKKRVKETPEERKQREAEEKKKKEEAEKKKKAKEEKKKKAEEKKKKETEKKEKKDEETRKKYKAEEPTETMLTGKKKDVRDEVAQKERGAIADKGGKLLKKLAQMKPYFAETIFKSRPEFGLLKEFGIFTDSYMAIFTEEAANKLYKILYEKNKGIQKKIDKQQANKTRAKEQIDTIKPEIDTAKPLTYLGIFVDKFRFPKYAATFTDGENFYNFNVDYVNTLNNLFPDAEQMIDSSGRMLMYVKDGELQGIVMRMNEESGIVQEAWVMKEEKVEETKEEETEETQEVVTKEQVEKAAPKFMKGKVNESGFFTESRYKSNSYPKLWTSSKDVAEFSIKKGDKVAIIETTEDGTRKIQIVFEKGREGESGDWIEVSYVVGKENIQKVLSAFNVDIKTEETKEETKPSPQKKTTKKGKKGKKGKKIEDVGEKIGGARKDMWAQTMEDYGEDLELNDIVKLPKAKVLPKLDYKGMKEKGYKDEDIHFLAWVLANTGKKPRRGRYTNYKLRAWAQTMITIRKEVSNALQDLENVGAITDTIKEQLNGTVWNKESWENTKAFYEQADIYENPKIATYYVNKDKPFENNTVKLQLIKDHYIMKNVIVGEGVNTREEAYTAFAEEVNQTKTSTKTSLEERIRKAISAYQNRKENKIFVGYKGKNGLIVEAEVFATKEEAQEAMKSPEKIEEWIKTIAEKIQRDENSYRENEAKVGERDYRKGKDVSAKKFMETFGFRGVEFGNWVTQKERTDRLNAAYDSFMDLALILGVDPKALGLNGELGFAFGSRGKAGALAHYESGKVVINLTKNKGAGSLAHEWWHAFDNYLKRRVGAPTGFLTQGGTYERAEIQEAFQNLMNFIQGSGIYTRSRKQDGYKGKLYFSTDVEMSARAFESFVKSELMKRDMKNSFLTGIFDFSKEDPNAEVNQDNPYALGGTEVGALTSLFNDIFSKIQVKEEGGRTAMFKSKARSNRIKAPSKGRPIVGTDYAIKYFQDLMERMGIEFDYVFAGNIIQGYKRKMFTDLRKAIEAYGMYDDGVILMAREFEKWSAEHEGGHLVLDYMELIPIFAEAGITREGLLRQQATEMGLNYDELTPTQLQNVEEELMEGFEDYLQEKYVPPTLIEKFYIKLRSLYRALINGIGKMTDDQIENFYELLDEGRVTDRKVGYLRNDGTIKAWIRQMKRDNIGTFDVTLFEKNAKAVRRQDRIEQMKEWRKENKVPERYETFMHPEDIEILIQYERALTENIELTEEGQKFVDDVLAVYDIVLPSARTKAAKALREIIELSEEENTFDELGGQMYGWQPRFKSIPEEETGVFDTTTGIPNYDALISNEELFEGGETKSEYYKRAKGMEGTLVYMTPDEYMNLVGKDAELLGGGRATAEQWRKSRESSMPNAREYFDKKVAAGEKIPALSIAYEKGATTQEGMHRAMWAKERGIEQVPVLIVNNPKLASRYTEVDSASTTGSPKFKTKNEGDKVLREVQKKYNELQDKVEEQTKKNEAWKKMLEEKTKKAAAIAEAISENTMKELARNVKRVRGEVELTAAGEELATELGFENIPEVNQMLGEYFADKIELNEVKKHMAKLRKDISELKREGKIDAQELKEVERKIKNRKKMLKTRDYYIDMGMKRGKNQQIKMMKARRRVLRELQDIYMIGDKRAKILLGGKDIRFMTEKEFEEFTEEFRVAADGISNQLLKTDEIQALIQEKQLSKTTNLIRSYGIESLNQAIDAINTLDLRIRIAEKQVANALNKASKNTDLSMQKTLDERATKQEARLNKMKEQRQMIDNVLNKVLQDVQNAQMNDMYLTQRQLETIHRTEWSGIKTVRELHEKISEVIGIPVEEINETTVPFSELMNNDVILARQGGFWKWLVEMKHSAIIEAGAELNVIRENLNKYARKARRSRSRGLFDILVPTDERVFNYIESEEKAKLAEDMTQEELDYANYVILLFSSARNYLASEYNMNTRENYMTHVRRGFLEILRKEKSIMAVFKEMFESQKEHEQAFQILSQQTGEILSFEKFFGFAMPRTGKIKPTENVAKAVEAYFSAFSKKKALDRVIPEAMTIATYMDSLQPVTEKGLPKGKTLERFIKTWLNNVKGRRFDYGGAIEQGSWKDLTLRGVTQFFSIIILAVSIPVQMASYVGEHVSVVRGLTYKQRFNLIKRFFDFRKRARIAKALMGVTGRNPIKELGDAGMNITDILGQLMFVGFSHSMWSSTKTYYRGALTEEEWSSGEVSNERLAEIEIEMNKFKLSQNYGRSILGSTSLSSAIFQFRSWAMPHLTTTVSEVKASAKKLREKGIKETMTDEDFKSVSRMVGDLMLVLALVAMIGESDDDDFLGRVRAKMIRELTTVAQALKIFTNLKGLFPALTYVIEIMASVTELIKLEEYKQDGKGYGIGDLKGLRHLTQELTPMAIRQFQGEEEQVDTKEKLVAEAIESGEFDAEKIAENEWRYGRGDTPDWKDMDDETKQEKIDIVNKLYRIRSMYPEHKEVSDILLSGDNNDEKIEKLLQLENPQQVSEAMKVLHADRKNMCVGKGKSGNYVDCLASDSLYKEYKKEYKKLYGG